jgi:hypothetical protein
VKDSPGRGSELTRGHLKSLGVDVSREKVRSTLKIIDPEGTEMRKSKPIKRRMYHSNGVHHVWHMDGWHKLIRYGMVVHAAIDGCSRFLLFAKCSTNNECVTVLKSFVCACEEVNVVPGCVRTDKGGENVDVCRFMLLVYDGNEDCFKASSSHYNQRVERNWRDMRCSTLQPYKDLFLHLEELGLDIENSIHMFCLQYMYVPRINESLFEFRNSWNSHGLSTERFQSPLSLLYTEVHSAGGIPWESDRMCRIVEEIVSNRVGNLRFQQVACETRSCPLNHEQFNVFISHCTPFTLQHDLLNTTSVFFDTIGNVQTLLMST